MAETLREYLSTPTRRRIVMIVTLVLGLLAIWPAVDEYTAKSAAQAQLADQLAKVAKAVASLPELEKQATAKKGELAQLEGMCVNEESLHLLRGRVVELARNCGCQIRQVKPGATRQKPWKPGDDPLDLAPTNQGNQNGLGYILCTQELTVSLSGKLANSKEFIEKLNGFGLLIHTRQLTVNSGGPSDKEVMVDLTLVLYDLQRREPVPG